MRCPCLQASVPLHSAICAPLRVLSLALGVCAATPALVGAQVTYFQRPPTPEQLRAALLPPAAVSVDVPAGGAPSLPNGSRTRGIVLQTEGGPSGTSAPLVAPTAAATSTAAGPAAALPINFELGSSRVDLGSMLYIETIAALMRSDPGLNLVVEGHTDGRGSFNRNMVLSWSRALGVFRALVETYGVEPRRLQPVGKGPLEPMPGTDPHDGANRRVQFRVSS